MRHASSAVFRHALLASCLAVVCAAGSALAQGPAPSCEISGPTDVQVGEPFMLCGIAGEGLTYTWNDPQGNVINHDRCLDFPNGIALPGTYEYEFVISQGKDFEKCPVIIRVTEKPDPEVRCWLTGGGLKTLDADGNEHSFGGNINPGCSPTAGEGGNWNNVDHTFGIHFQGRQITVLRCGNVPGIPTGSESPVTPVNFIEFTGTGRMFGVMGNKSNYPDVVYFWGHYEDREEPGSSGQPDPDKRDRYFLHVYSDPNNPNGSTLMLIDMDGDPSTVDPRIITHGNLQMHFQPCQKFDDFAANRGVLRSDEGARPTELSFSAGPNPASGQSVLRFGLPQGGDVSLKIFDVAGRELADLGRSGLSAGLHSVSWDLTDRAGQRVSRGIYFARLSVNGQTRTQHLIVSQ